MRYKDYIGTVSYSAEDEVFYGKVHGINDLVTFEGNSVRQLKSAFKSSIEDYLDTCVQLNKTPDKTFKGSFNIRISPELHKQASEKAFKKQMTLNEFVKEAIKRAVGS